MSKIFFYFIRSIPKKNKSQEAARKELDDFVDKGDQEDPLVKSACDKPPGQKCLPQVFDFIDLIITQHLCKVYHIYWMIHPYMQS